MAIQNVVETVQGELKSLVADATAKEERQVALQAELAQLETEREGIAERIQTLEGFLASLNGDVVSSTPRKGRVGRPPGSKNKRRGPGRPPKEQTKTKRSGKGWTPAARKAAAERMKAYWAKRNK